MKNTTSITNFQVDSNHRISCDIVHSNYGVIQVTTLSPSHASLLFDFYFQGLSSVSRNFFLPYPLFSPEPSSSLELEQRINDWQSENDWFFYLLLQFGKVLGVCLLKRTSTSKPTTGIAVHKEYRRQGLASLLYKIIDYQAFILKLPVIYSGAAPDNQASIQLHLSCGYKLEDERSPHYSYLEGQKIIDRYDFKFTRKVPSDLILPF